MSEHNGSTQFPPQKMARSVGQLAHDVVTLAELQSELVKVDVQDFMHRSLRPVAALAAAVVIGLGCVPVALAALGLGLVHAGLPLWSSFAIATAVGLGAAAISGVLGWWWLRRSSQTFERSKQEFQNNVQWLKRVLKGTTAA